MYHYDDTKCFEAQSQYKPKYFALQYCWKHSIPRINVKNIIRYATESLKLMVAQSYPMKRHILDEKKLKEIFN